MRQPLTFTILLAAALASPSVRAYELMTTSEGVPVVWMRDDVRFLIDDVGTAQIALSEVERAVAKSFDAWNDVPESSLRLNVGGLVAGETVGYRPDGTVNLIKFYDSAWTFGDSALAVTLSTWAVPSGELLDADIAVNSAEFDWAVDGRNRHYDLVGALTHEVGHVVGLGHSEDGQATMYASMGPGETAKRDLGEDDIEGFQFLYGTSDTVGPSTRPTDSETGGPAGSSPFDFPELEDPSQESGAGVPSSDDFTLGCNTISGASPSVFAILLIGLVIFRRRSAHKN